MFGHFDFETKHGQSPQHQSDGWEHLRRQVSTGSSSGLHCSGNRSAKEANAIKYQEQRKAAREVVHARDERCDRSQQSEIWPTKNSIHYTKRHENSITGCKHPYQTATESCNEHAKSVGVQSTNVVCKQATMQSWIG